MTTVSITLFVWLTCSIAFTIDDTANDGGAKDFMRAPGSEHYPNQEFFPQQHGNDYKHERDQ